MFTKVEEPEKEKEKEVSKTQEFFELISLYNASDTKKRSAVETTKK